MRLGIAINPFTVSDNSHTVPVFSTEAITTVTVCKRTNFFHTPAPKRYWAQRIP